MKEIHNLKVEILIVISILLNSCDYNNSNDKKENTFPPYPQIASSPVTENYFGVDVTDDYRNIENTEDSITKNWFKEQATYANKILNRISRRDTLLRKMNDYENRKLYSISLDKVTENGQLFFLKDKSGDDLPKLYYRKNFNAEDEILFNPKDFKPQSENNYHINYIKPSWDGLYVVVALSHSGSEISEMIIIDMETRKPLPQVITHCWPSDGDGVSWLPNNKSFVYLHFPVIDISSDLFLKNTKSVLYHLGDNPTELNVIFSNDTQKELDINEADFPAVYIKDRSDSFIIGCLEGPSGYYDAYYANINELNSSVVNWKPLFKKSKKIKKEIFIKNSLIYLSAQNSKGFQLLKSDLDEKTGLNKTTLLADPKENEVINDFTITSDGIYYTATINGVQSKLYKIESGIQKEIVLPQLSGKVNISSNGISSPDLWVSTTGWLNDFIRYKYDSSENKFIEQMISQNAEYPEFNNLLIKEITVKGVDDVQIPMSIIYQNDIKMNGENPTLMYGYGSYGKSVMPYFSTDWLTWVEEGGVLCIAHVRGGGEKGDLWYESGKKKTKPNTWKDLISCTEYMISEGYTSNQKTIINGRSAGGILIGRAMTEAPELFAVSIPEVGILNVSRFENTTNGPNNIKEFGTMKDSLESNFLIEMDAYLHIKEDEEYPATLITTGMNDPRVTPWQPGKFAAKLQLKTKSKKPIIFSVDYKSGHGIGNSKTTKFLNHANKYAFAFWQTGHKGYYLKD